MIRYNVATVIVNRFDDENLAFHFIAWAGKRHRQRRMAQLYHVSRREPSDDRWESNGGLTNTFCQSPDEQGPANFTARQASEQDIRYVGVDGRIVDRHQRYPPCVRFSTIVEFAASLSMPPRALRRRASDWNGRTARCRNTRTLQPREGSYPKGAD